MTDTITFLPATSRTGTYQGIRYRNPDGELHTIHNGRWYTGTIVFGTFDAAPHLDATITLTTTR